MQSNVFLRIRVLCKQALSVSSNNHDREFSSSSLVDFVLVICNVLHTPFSLVDSLRHSIKGPAANVLLVFFMMVFCTAATGMLMLTDVYIMDDHDLDTQFSGFYQACTTMFVYLQSGANLTSFA